MFNLELGRDVLSLAPFLFAQMLELSCWDFLDLPDTWVRLTLNVVVLLVPLSFSSNLIGGVIYFIAGVDLARVSKPALVHLRI